MSLVRRISAYFAGLGKKLFRVAVISAAATAVMVVLDALLVGDAKRDEPPPV
jgi:anti-sigma-K factor RskA